MDNTAFLAAYNECRNGANSFFRHPLVRNFIYSDGVKSCAEAGCYWLIDVFATELPEVFKKNEHVSNMATVHVVVDKGQAFLRAEFEDDIVAWKKHVEYTDMPDGSYLFLMADEFEGPARYRLILVTEY